MSHILFDHPDVSDFVAKEFYKHYRDIMKSFGSLLGTESIISSPAVDDTILIAESNGIFPSCVAENIFGSSPHQKFTVSP